MRIITNLLILSSLLFTPCSCALADIPIGNQASYGKLIENADVIHLGESRHFIDRTSRYVSKWNSEMLIPVKGKKNIYVIKSMIGGINKSNIKKHVIALINLRQLEDLKNPAANIGIITINGKPAKYKLFVPGSSLTNLIETVNKSIGEKEILTARITSKSPLLFIDAGLIQPGASARIEYEITSPNEILIN